MNKNKNYDEVIKEFGIDKIKERYEYLRQQINEFLEVSNYKNITKCNDIILMHVIIDYYSDIQRVKKFHDIPFANVNKINAYLIFWILKRKPIIYTLTNHEENDQDLNDIFVNERFCVSLVVNEILFVNDNPILCKDILNEYEDYIHLLLYNFKYRYLDAYSIELFISSFKTATNIERYNKLNK